MSKLSEALRGIGVFNTHNLLTRFGVKGKDIAVVYCPSPPGRMGIGRPDKTIVMSPSHKTDRGAHWTHNGCMAFSGKKTESMPKAIDWATDRYGIEKWVADPTDRSAKIPEYVLEAAKKAVK